MASAKYPEFDSFFNKAEEVKLNKLGMAAKTFSQAIWKEMEGDEELISMVHVYPQGSIFSMGTIVAITDKRFFWCDSDIASFYKLEDILNVNADFQKVVVKTISDATSFGEKSTEKNWKPKFVEQLKEQINKSKNKNLSPEPKQENSDDISKLERLASLFQKGLITADEYAIQKGKILYG